MEFGNRRYLALAVAAAALGAAACGGSSGGGDGGATPTTTPNAVSRGAIRSFGSVMVNGVEWRTNGAELITPDDSTTRRRLQGETEIRGALKKGQVVTVKGRLDADGRRGQATEVEYHRSVEGIVSGKSARGFTAGGLKVSIDATTSHYNEAGDDSSYAALADGKRVEVSGVPDDRGGLRASAVRVSASTETEAEVKGYVLPGAAGGTFQLALTPGGAAFITVSAGSFAVPASGAFVEVKGSVAGTPPTLTLTRAPQLEDELRGEAQMEAEVEGIVSSGTLASFVVAGRTVTTTASTTYTGLPAGSTAAAELAVGVKVEAEGQLDASGALVARKVKFKDGARMGGAPASVTATSFVLLGNQTVVIDSATQIEGDAGVTLATATFVEVRGFRLADGSTYAQRLKLRSGGGGGNRPFLQGVVQAAASPSLTVNGIAVQTSSATEFQDDTQSENETPITQAQFFQKVAVGSIVKVDWDTGTTSFTGTPAREVELEAEDD